MCAFFGACLRSCACAYKMVASVIVSVSVPMRFSGGAYVCVRAFFISAGVTVQPFLKAVFGDFEAPWYEPCERIPGNSNAQC